MEMTQQLGRIQNLSYTPPPPDVLRYCIYARKSSEAEEKQALSIDSQISEMTQLAEREQLEVLEIKSESHSAKDSGTRKVFNEMLEEIEVGKYNAIISWDASRISRSGGDIGRIIDLMDRGKLVEIRTHAQNFTKSPNDKFLLMILASQAKLENDNRGINIKRGLRAKCDRGARPGAVPLGYRLIRSTEFGKPSEIIVDEERAPFIKKMFQYVLDGCSGQQVNEYLTEEGFRTKRGKKVTLSMTYRIFKEPFYYGEFEYPKESGNWYKGSHIPLINKETHEEVNKRLEVPDKGKWGRKQFYFKQIFKCAHCGSGITGEEKINRHGKLYVYYRCNRFGRTKCRSKYISEKNLIESVSKIVDQLRSDTFRLNKRLLREVDKINKIQKINQGQKTKPISILEYIRYVLENGNGPEKRDLLKCVDKQLHLKDGEVVLG